MPPQGDNALNAKFLFFIQHLWKSRYPPMTVNSFG